MIEKIFLKITLAGFDKGAVSLEFFLKILICKRKVIFMAVPVNYSEIIAKAALAVSQKLAIKIYVQYAGRERCIFF